MSEAAHTREPGFYWVKTAYRWTIAEWYDDEIWLISGSELPFYDHELERIIEEPLQNPNS